MNDLANAVETAVNKMSLDDLRQQVFEDLYEAYSRHATETEIQEFIEEEADDHE